MTGDHSLTLAEALELAERYALRGIPTFPIAVGWDAEKDKTSKRPLTGHGHLSASTDLRRVRSMFNGCRVPAGEALGVGIYLGPAGIFALDADRDSRGDGVAELAEVLERFGVRASVRTRSASGGVHVWLYKGTRHVGNASPFSSIDIRGDDGWIVAPGTVTPWGEWSFDPDGDLFDGLDVAAAPDTLLDHIGARDGGDDRPRAGAGDRSMPADMAPADAAALAALIDLGGSYSHRDARGVIYVRRPGKDSGASASVGYVGPGVVKVFTSNWPPLRLNARYTADELRALLQGEPGAPEPELAAAAEPASDEMHLIAWPDFWNGEADGPDWLLEPLIARGRGHALYAGAKSGKSLLMLSAAAALATGRAWLNNPARTPADVLYLDFEMTRDDLRERLETFGYGPDDDLSHLHYASLPTIDPLDTYAGADLVVATAKRLGVVHVIIDTTSRAVAGEENSSDTFRTLYRLVGLRLKELGIGYHRLDHSGKDVEKGQRGSSAKNDDVDVVQQLVRRDAGGLTLRATHHRMQWVPDSTELAFAEVDGVMVYSTAPANDPDGTWHVVRFLDKREIPTSWGRRQVREYLKAEGPPEVQVRNDALGTALKIRRSREIGAV